MLKARDVMSKDLREVGEDASVQDAARVMVRDGISSLIVHPAGREEPYGIITTRDVANAFADGMDLAEARVWEVASTPLVVVTPGVPVAYVARLMKKAGLRHIAVFNGREVVGIISNMDVVRAVAHARLEPPVAVEP